MWNASSQQDREEEEEEEKQTDAGQPNETKAELNKQWKWLPDSTIEQKEWKSKIPIYRGMKMWPVDECIESKMNLLDGCGCRMPNVVK